MVWFERFFLQVLDGASKRVTTQHPKKQPTGNPNKLAKLRSWASRESFEFVPNQPTTVTNSLTKLDATMFSLLQNYNLYS